MALMFYFVALGIFGTVDVIIRTPDGKPAGKTKYTYYLPEVEEVLMQLITSFQPPEGKSVGEQGVNLGREENSGENSTTSSSFSGSYYYTLFFYIRMLFFRPRLNIVIFLSILGSKYS